MSINADESANAAVRERRTTAERTDGRAKIRGRVRSAETGVALDMADE
jgi:hypothetical protein